MRELFPEYCFKRKAYGSAEIHQLQGAQEESDGEISVTNENAFLLTQWLEQGVFEALQEQYLNTMTFSIYCAHPITGKDLLIENYEFKVSYAEGEEPARINNVELTSKDAVKNQAIKFIRSLTQFTQTLDKLPADRWITLSLTVSYNIVDHMILFQNHAYYVYLSLVPGQHTSRLRAEVLQAIRRWVQHQHEAPELADQHRIPQDVHRGDEGQVCRPGVPPVRRPLQSWHRCFLCRHQARFVQRCELQHEWFS